MPILILVSVGIDVDEICR